MTLQECYALMEGDYAGVLGRLGKEARVDKFLKMFPEEPSYGLLCRSLEAGDGAEAFRAAHSLKGICMNLGLTGLLSSSSALSDELRAGAITGGALACFERVKADYETAQGCILSYRKG